jgi:hypothetical protein
MRISPDGAQRQAPRQGVWINKIIIAWRTTKVIETRNARGIYPELCARERLCAVRLESIIIYRSSLAIYDILYKRLFNGVNLWEHWRNRDIQNLARMW